MFALAAEIVLLGLAVPHVTRIFMRLSEIGYPVDPHTYTVQAAKKQVLDLFAAKEKEGR